MILCKHRRLWFALALCLVPQASSRRCFGESSMTGRPWYWWSANGDYGVRFVPNRDRRQKAQIFVLRYDRERHTCTYVADMRLPNNDFPRHVVVTDDGRYVVVLGRSNGSKPALPHAILIYDLKRNRSKDFALTDFLSPAQIKKHVIRIPMSASVYWFETDYDNTLGPVFDPTSEQIILTPRLEGVYVERWYIDDAREKPNMASVFERPTIVISLRDMTVRVVPRSESGVWRHRLERDLLRQYLLATALVRPWPDRRSRELVDLLMDMARPARIEDRFVGHNRNSLARMTPGDGKRNAEICVLEFDDEKRTCRTVRHVRLVNRVAPDYWKVSSGGRYVVTLDDLGQIGVTENAVVIYDLDENKRKQFRVEDLFSEKEIKQFPFSVPGFRMWRAAGRHLSAPCFTFRGHDLSFWLITPKYLREHVPRISVNVIGMKVQGELPVRNTKDTKEADPAP